MNTDTIHQQIAAYYFAAAILWNLLTPALAAIAKQTPGTADDEAIDRFYASKWYLIPSMLFSWGDYLGEFVAKLKAAGKLPKLPPALLALALILPLAACVPACKTLAPGGPYNGDTALYNAEYAVTTSYTVFDTFLKWEYENRATLEAANPTIAKDTKAAADYIRANAKSWINAAIVTIEAYKKANTPETREALEAALAKLQSEVIKAATYIKT